MSNADEFGMVQDNTGRGRPKTWSPDEVFAQIGEANFAALVCKTNGKSYTGTFGDNVKLVNVPVTVSGAKESAADFAKVNGWTIVSTVRNVIRMKRNAPVEKAKRGRPAKAK